MAPKKTQKNTNEASMLLKTQGSFEKRTQNELKTNPKRTQNELNFERQMHRLNPNSELSRARVRAGGSRLEMRKGAEVIRFRKPGASREKHKNTTNEASMLLKTQGAFGKRTQNEPKIAAKTHSFCRKRSKICAPHYVGAWRAEAVVADPGDDRAPRAVSRDFQSKTRLDDG
jgi:hypothetical protein